MNYLCQLFVLSSRDQLTRSVLLSFHPQRPESACQVGEMGVGVGVAACSTAVGSKEKCGNGWWWWW